MPQKKYRKYRFAAHYLVLGMSLLWGCSVNQPELGGTAAPVEGEQEESTQVVDAVVAYVISVEAVGDSNAYRFSVEIASPDTGCDQYADWWEVLTEGGDLVYRRILAHSHVDEQPFVRSGGPVAIDADTVVIVRAHMNPSGYGGTGMMGTVDTGFAKIPFNPDFAPEVEDDPPQPTGCAF